MESNIINTWKELYNYLCPEKRHNKFHEKIYRKIFSIISRNRWVCERNVNRHGEDGILVKHSYNGFNLSFEMSKLADNAKWNKIPSELNFTYIESKGGLKLRSNYLRDMKVRAIELSDGSIELVNYNNLNDILHGNSDCVKLYPSEVTLRNEYISNNPNKFLKIDKYFKDGTYVMVLEDCLWFKRGQIIKNYTRYDGWRSKSSPSEILKDYCSITTTIECDLNLELSLPQESQCEKGKFGCRRGCYNSCFSESDNNAKRNLYNIMKKYKDILNEII